MVPFFYIKPMYCIKTGCKERQKYIHIFQNSLKYSSASLSVSWKRLYNFSNCAVAIQWLACMQFIAMQANDWISNPLPNEQNADAQQTQKRVSAVFANVEVRLDAQKSVQPHSWNLFGIWVGDGWTVRTNLINLALVFGLYLYYNKYGS